MGMVPGRWRGSGDTPGSGCSCLVVGIVVAAILSAILFGFAMHAVDVIEAGWQN